MALFAAVRTQHAAEFPLGETEGTEQVTLATFAFGAEDGGEGVRPTVGAGGRRPGRRDESRRGTSQNPRNETFGGFFVPAGGFGKDRRSLSFNHSAQFLRRGGENGPVETKNLGSSWNAFFQFGCSLDRGHLPVTRSYQRR